ncbi:hypothetical protein MHBO_000307 [Bonamia ostreae]|uniref:Uncharacterized protein n=1 Tax=Bonamia ostreae TaxID=126728 RepID=A0ABV2AF71_9EUKA
MVKDVSDSELAERLHREISLTPPPHIFKLRYNGSVLEYVRKLPLFVVLDVIAKSVNHFFDSAIIGSLYYLDTASGIGASAGVLSHDISQVFSLSKVSWRVHSLSFLRVVEEGVCVFLCSRLFSRFAWRHLGLFYSQVHQEHTAVHSVALGRELPILGAVGPSSSYYAQAS